ncbi:MAG: hypothetical protein IIY21_09530 [Clostridiales bacterium]|nr:hypothetical protein [Clostridiales bacterium]
MRRFSKSEQDDIMFEKEQLEKEIIKLNAKPYLSEYEFQTLQTDKAKLRNLRRILNGNN